MSEHSQEPIPQEEQTQETPVAPRPRRRGSRVQRRAPVFLYLAILFAVAFLMLLLAYFQQQRTNRESTDALKESVSAVQSIQNLIDDNQSLRDRNGALEQQAANLEAELERRKAQDDGTQAEIQALQNQVLALQWFWQIESAYARGRYTTTRELIEQFEAAGLAAFLPAENTTGTQRFSPAARYQEIYDALY